MIGNLALARVTRPRWKLAVNLQLEPAALYVGAIWNSSQERVVIADRPDPKLAPPSIAVRKFDLWIHPLPLIGLHVVVWRIG